MNASRIAQQIASEQVAAAMAEQVAAEMAGLPGKADEQRAAWLNKRR